MATPQTSHKKQRKQSAKQRPRGAQKRDPKDIPLKSEVDEPRPQPPADEGRQEAARREAAHSNGIDDEPGRDRSLFDLPEEDRRR